jgi:hypothetical protein
LLGVSDAEEDAVGCFPNSGEGGLFNFFPGIDGEDRVAFICFPNIGGGEGAVGSLPKVDGATLVCFSDIDGEGGYLFDLV